MDKGIYVALSGAVAQQSRLNMISNNLANANSTGFKSDGLLFESYLKKTEGSSGKEGDVPVFVRAESGYSDHSQGPVVETGHDLDIAIEGSGFFLLESEKGLLVTRNGHFKKGSGGYLETLEGRRVLGINKSGATEPLLLETGGSFKVSSSGQVFTYQKDKDGNVRENNKGKLALIDFKGVYDLTKVQGSLFKVHSGDESITPSKAMVKQGFLEKSNVNIIQEMAHMITVTRGVETYQKMIRAYDEMKNTLISQVP
ncbi:MAG: flagellar hook-basal body protein [Nitrospinota bacterium]